MSVNQIYPIQPIAHIRTDFPEKFGLPRQSMLINSLIGRIVFEPTYRNADALRGMEDYSHLWLIWQFSEAVRDEWTATVRPPRLGGNKRMGVFATRSPYRPNALALSCVKIENIDLHTSQGPVITVSGIDMLDNTPIFDIKPYLPHIDSIPDAKGGFALTVASTKLEVKFETDDIKTLPVDFVSALRSILEQDPRPHYHDDKNRIYGFKFRGYEIRFSVLNDTLFVQSVIPE